MFKFSFFNAEDNASSSIEKPSSDDDKLLWLQSEQIELSNLPLLKEILEHNEVNTFKCDDAPEILHLSVNLIIDIIKRNHLQNSIINAETNHSDLLPAIYEGGLKIWECTYDLLNFIVSSKFNFHNKKVLDLGCGVGIIGIYCLLNGAEVYFQDYNQEVLQYVTIPNTVLNLGKNIESEVLKSSKFYCGDWRSFSDVMHKEEVQFDYIFTSETIYNTSNYGKLHMLFKKCLNTNGTIYLSAKTYYFGVGGGLRSFEDYIQKEDIFCFTTCWKTISGLQREILKLSFKSSD